MVLGKSGGITLTPPNPGIDGCVLLAINDGDRYHILLPGVPNSTIPKNDAKTFLIKNALVEGLCPTLACGTFVTTWGSAGTANGQFNFPLGVATDSSGNVYVADLDNNRIQKFDASGTFLTTWGSLGSGNGQFARATGVATDGSGNVYVADAEPRIQKFACP